MAELQTIIVFQGRHFVRHHDSIRRNAMRCTSPKMEEDGAKKVDFEISKKLLS